jgi:hypothetical protein
MASLDQKISALTDLGAAEDTDYLLVLRALENGKLSLSAIRTLLAAADGSVALAKLANIATGKVLGNVSGDPAAPAELSGTQVTALLDAFAGEGGSAAKGLVPSPGTAAKFPRIMQSDGDWAPNDAPFVPVPVGQWHMPWVPLTQGQISNQASVNVLPWYVAVDSTFDTLVQELITAQSGAKLWCAFYDWNDGNPGNCELLFDFGELDLSTGAGGAVTRTLSPAISVPRGWYWGAAFMPAITTAPVILCNTNGWSGAWHRSSYMGGQNSRGFSRGVTYPTSGAPATIGNVSPTAVNFAGFMLNRSA